MVHFGFSGGIPGTNNTKIRDAVAGTVGPWWRPCGTFSQIPSAVSEVMRPQHTDRQTTNLISGINPLVATLKPQSNGPSYSNTVTGTLALLHLVQRGGDWAGLQPAQSPSRCTECNSPPINGQCTNFVFDVAL